MKLTRKLKSAPALAEKVRVVVRFGRVLVYDDGVYRAGELLYMAADEVKNFNMVEIATPAAIEQSAGPAPTVEDRTLLPFVVKFRFSVERNGRYYKAGDIVELTAAEGARSGQVEAYSEQALLNAAGPKIIPDDPTVLPWKVRQGFHFRHSDEIYSGGMIMQLTAREASLWGGRVELQTA